MYQKGLMNLGNTCYLNATIQCLYHLKPFVNYMLSKKLYYDKGITGKFIKVLEYLSDSTYNSYKSVYLEDFVSSFFYGNVMFKKGEQNDCHIFLVTLLNTMNKEMKTYYQDETISKLFCNYIENKTSSNYDYNPHVDREPSFCISLPIKNKKGKAFSTLEECIKNYQESKVLVDSYTGKKVKEEAKIYLTGNFLVFNLQRVSEGRHIPNLIKYNEILKFGNYTYELVGLIKHIGNEYSGHKVALCKEANTWFEFDDTKVTTLSSAVPIENLVFLLFYEKKNNNPSSSLGVTFDKPEKKSYSDSFSSILEKFKVYEMEEKEKEKKNKTFIEKIYGYCNVNNENDFFKLYPGQIISRQDFTTLFKIDDIPDYFIENYDVNYFKVVAAFKKFLGK